MRNLIILLLLAVNPCLSAPAGFLSITSSDLPGFQGVMVRLPPDGSDLPASAPIDPGVSGLIVNDSCMKTGGEIHAGPNTQLRVSFVGDTGTDTGYLNDLNNSMWAFKWERPPTSRTYKRIVAQVLNLREIEVKPGTRYRVDCLFILGDYRYYNIALELNG